jgi:hypothetical protein
MIVEWPFTALNCEKSAAPPEPMFCYHAVGGIEYCRYIVVRL